MCISGLTSLQRSLWESAKAGRIGKVPWMLIGSGNKLIDLHNLYCGGDELDKSLVKIFIDGTLDDVRANFQVWQGLGKEGPRCMHYPTVTEHCYLSIYLQWHYWNAVCMYSCKFCSMGLCFKKSCLKCFWTSQKAGWDLIYKYCYENVENVPTYVSLKITFFII